MNLVSLLEDSMGILILMLAWPGIIVALILVTGGLIIRNAQFIQIATGCCLPFTYVLFSYTSFGLIIPICFLLGAYLSSKKAHILATIMIMPVYIFLFYLGYAFYNQPDPDRKNYKLIEERKENQQEIIKFAKTQHQPLLPPGSPFRWPVRYSPLWR